MPSVLYSVKAILIRYADDFVIGFEYKDDAQRVMDALSRRLGHFGLTLHPDKTRLLPFRRPSKGQTAGKGRATFDFLGFSLYWARTRKGRCGMFCKTRSASLRRAIGSVYDWCRRHRHLSVKEQHAALTRRIQGHFNYFGVSGNFRSLLLVIGPNGITASDLARRCRQLEHLEGVAHAVRT